LLRKIIPNCGRGKRRLTHRPADLVKAQYHIPGSIKERHAGPSMVVDQETSAIAGIGAQLSRQVGMDLRAEGGVAGVDIEPYRARREREPIILDLEI